MRKAISVIAGGSAGYLLYYYLIMELKTKDKVLSIRISDEMYQRLLQYTEKHNESMTKVATKGLEKILSRDK